MSNVKSGIFKSILSKSSMSVFAIILVLFFFPFINVSCQGKKLFKLTGVQLATGTTIDQTNAYGQTEKQKVNPLPAAIIAIVVTVIGFALGFSKHKLSPGFSAACAVAGIASVLLMKASLDNSITNQGQGMLDAEYPSLTWLIILYALAAISIAIQLSLKNGKLFKLGGSGNIADIEKLAALKEKGLITAEEYEQKKKQLLNL